MQRLMTLMHLYLIAEALMLIQLQYWVHAEKGLDLVTCVGAKFDTFDNITPVEEDSWYKGQSVSYKNGGVWLNPDPREAQTRSLANIGKIIYKDKVRFKYGDHGLISFNTSFIFQILSTNPYPKCGSGMVFFIADYAKAPERSYGRYFGLVSPNAVNNYRFFAVEFDTHITEEFEDPSGSHIGIDVNSLKSLIYADTQLNSSYPHLCLYSNYTFTAWIEYDAHRKLIQVWMNNSTSLPRPQFPSLTLNYDLSSVFNEYMYVGFSASNNASEDSMEGHVLYSWNFTTYPPSSCRSTFCKLLLPLIVPLFIVSVLSVCTVSSYYIVKARKKKKQIVKPISTHIVSSRGGYSGPGPDSLLEYSCKELKKASQSFADVNKVGEGTFSTVYKGTLSNGAMVAIKRLKEGFRKEREFASEIEIISKLRHRNLVPLLGWCYDKGEALLVYQYMSKGSLSTYLYGEHKGSLSSEVRLNILIGVASALEYLHRNLQDCVLHRDVKAANVLLTDKFEPMLGDFGLARLIRHNEGSVTMTAVGTPGYVAPEVVYTNRATDKADVYSFGVLALVVTSGRPAMLRSPIMPQYEDVRLVDSISTLHQSNQLMKALDPTMCLPDSEKDKWGSLLHVALMCTNPFPESRPTMRQVCQALQGDNFLLKEPLPAATRPMYPLTQSWPSAWEWYNRDRGRNLSVSMSEAGGFSISTGGQASMSASTFDPSNENWVGR